MEINLSVNSFQPLQLSCIVLWWAISLPLPGAGSQGAKTLSCQGEQHCCQAEHFSSHIWILTKDKTYLSSVSWFSTCCPFLLMPTVIQLLFFLPLVPDGDYMSKFEPKSEMQVSIHAIFSDSLNTWAEIVTFCFLGGSKQMVKGSHRS